ncbi:hypothetical protein [Promicromonospora sp. NPDC050880]|uniref:hypothetical protein n=1 Tax=Promicromonospora sp. NPDC050880 TaxID=3364406 RepID=UPI00379A7F7B
MRNENLRHADDFLSDYDLWMHQRYKELLKEVIPSFIYASEEDDPQVIGDDPDPDCAFWSTRWTPAS